MLKKCPDCDHDVSDLAPTCPNCGRPMMAQTIQATSKKWKKVIVCGSVIAAIGGAITIAGVVALDAGGRAWMTDFLERFFEAGGRAWMTDFLERFFKHADASIILGSIIFGVGVAVSLCGKVGGWWGHG